MTTLRQQIETEINEMHPNAEERRACRRCEQLVEILHQEALEEDVRRWRATFVEANGFEVVS